MRPTDLKFRSPKEKTPEYYDVGVTITGNTLFASPSRLRPNFSKASRFPQYEINAKRTGYRVGPGSYELKQDITKKGPIYKKNHAEKDLSNNGYYYLGDQIVFEPSFVLKSKRASINDITPRIDASQVLPNRPLRPASAIEAGEKSPWFLRKSVDFTLTDETRTKTPQSPERPRTKPNFPKRAFIRSPYFSTLNHKRANSSFEKY
ncbi:unnamed protein product [Blepharisma stoltei]|uniref:Uncharacterized protein n=1 Tax=Blepharisma stoltei TaxID=1481888 RepID=A0AAU9JM48_9CILI|nr:unnamed protein product [Blepharisma stoltei]